MTNQIEDAHESYEQHESYEWVSFLLAVKDGMFNEYDGTAYYATPLHETNVPVFSENNKINPSPFGTTHVNWYPK